MSQAQKAIWDLVVKCIDLPFEHHTFLSRYTFKRSALKAEVAVYNGEGLKSFR